MYSKNLRPQTKSLQLHFIRDVEGNLAFLLPPVLNRKTKMFPQLSMLFPFLRVQLFLARPNKRLVPCSFHFALTLYEKKLEFLIILCRFFLFQNQKMGNVALQAKKSVSLATNTIFSLIRCIITLFFCYRGALPWQKQV